MPWQRRRTVGVVALDGFRPQAWPFFAPLGPLDRLPVLHEISCAPALATSTRLPPLFINIIKEERARRVLVWPGFDEKRHSLGTRRRLVRWTLGRAFACRLGRRCAKPRAGIRPRRKDKPTLLGVRSCPLKSGTQPSTVELASKPPPGTPTWPGGPGSGRPEAHCSTPLNR
jgi:hypothetical protein